MRRAKARLEETKPYFDALREEAKHILSAVKPGDSRYFDPAGEEDASPPGVLVITADRGLAGAYNHNVVQETLRARTEYQDMRLFVVGEYGRHYFSSQKIPFENDFSFTAQDPTLQRARHISDVLLEEFLSGKISRIFVIYTAFKNSLESCVRTERLLPFSREDFSSPGSAQEVPECFPSAEEVLQSLVPAFVCGYVYSALVSSFCCEMDARMNAMDLANRNAQDLLEELRIQYNHIRQNAITREITEVSSGAKSMKKNRKKREGGVTA